MKLLNRLRPDARRSPAKPLAEAPPAPALQPPGPADLRLFIDLCVAVGPWVFVAGWCADDVDLVLLADGHALPAERLPIERPDVAAAGVPRPGSGRAAGFALRVRGPAATARLTLQVTSDRGQEPARPLAPETFSLAHAGACSAMGHGLAWMLEPLRASRTEAEFLVLARAMPRADHPATLAGFIDAVLGDAQTGSAVACGWLHAPPDTVAWLESPRGEVFSLSQGFRTRRDDVDKALEQMPGRTAGADAVFLVALSGAQPGEVWRLQVLTDRGVHSLAESTCGHLPGNPVEALKVLCGFETPIGRAAERMLRVDQPVIAPMAAQWRAAIAQLPATVHALGDRPARPLVSVVVPLYRRLDFMEPQLMKLGADPWMREHADLVYVVDDPALVEPLRGQAEHMAALSGMGFRWVWGGANRGFAGANNLGVAHCHAPAVLFMNSDVFPCRPGWLPSLLSVLDAHPEVGVVAPRLLHTDGSLQHAGMRFQQRASLGIWVNEHPHKGLPPELDPVREPACVPAVTGACMLVRRTDLAAVGGWDEAYLAGDFEDSDLCLKLLGRGLHSVYHPEVELVHLERQSLSALGDPGFRSRLVVYNAVRHQARWASDLSRLAGQPVEALADLAKRRVVS